MKLENIFTVYFEVGGKKLKTKVLAENEQQARKVVLDKVKFHKVEKSKDGYNSIVDSAKDLMDALGVKSK